jgi:hypothetical protein
MRRDEHMARMGGGKCIMIFVNNARRNETTKKTKT